MILRPRSKRYGSRLKGYLAGRSALLLALLLLAALFQTRPGAVLFPFTLFFILTAVAFCVTLASAVVLKQDATTRPWLAAQPAWDTLYATALVYLSGGVLSPFAVLYAVVIIGAATLLLRRGAVWVATSASIAYGSLADLQYFGIVDPYDPFPVNPIGGEVFLPQLVFNIAAFYAVAFLAGHLAEELRRAGERLEEAQAEVLDLEHLKDLILLNLGSGLIALDLRGREMFHNTAAEDLLDRAGVLLQAGMDVSAHFDLAGGSRNEKSFADGKLILGYSVAPLSDRESILRGRILIFQDVSAVKKLEEDLRRADRLAAVGRLSAGLAHEIRNPLASLAGSVEVLRQGGNCAPEDAPLLEIVLRETDRLNQLVTNFLHYARPGNAAVSEIRLADLVREAAFFFSQGEGRVGFTLDNRVPENLILQGDRAQLEQLLLNLFRNSVDAAPGGVHLEVTAAGSSDGITVQIGDDGPGMPEEVAQQAFEPFFTRKEGGTGLGLATVHRIVENHAGTIRLQTTEGVGTVFTIHLPGA